jgi:hypothetical protein
MLRRRRYHLRRVVPRAITEDLDECVRAIG